MRPSTTVIFAATVAASALAISACSVGKGDTTNNYSTPGPTATSAVVKHVLLISIDGMREFDYDWIVQNNPTGALATLAGQGVVFENAYTPFPSDSYPGLMAIITGGLPGSTGIYYDHTYDSTLFSTAITGLQSHEILFDESLTDATGLAINPAYLPTTLAGGLGTKIYPHNYLKVNTVFEVLHATGAVTAWSDKHPAYDICNGPSGTGVTDLYCPEIRASPGSIESTDTVPHCMAYDDGKVTAIINQIDGKKSTGGTTQAVPIVFGMNFQAVSVAQKICAPANQQTVGSPGVYPAVTVVPGKMGGYKTSTPGVPGGVLTPNADTLNAMVHTDASIGRMINELKIKNLWDSTLVIITAKHGQGGLDPATVNKVDEAKITAPILALDANAVFSDDDVGIIWLNDKTKLAASVAALQADTTLMASVQSILTGNDIAARFGNTNLTRIPDIIIMPKPGTLYSLSSKKNSDHGGPADDDTHVICLVANPNLVPNTINTRVNTTQIAPTILQQLGQNPQALQAVVLESTPILPGLQYGSPSIPSAPN